MDWKTLAGKTPHLFRAKLGKKLRFGWRVARVFVLSNFPISKMQVGRERIFLSANCNFQNDCMAQINTSGLADCDGS
jgi:hypothetical protein